MFDAFLTEKGYLAMGGQIVDATIVTAPRQHYKREENETIKAGETPKDWKDKPAKDRQKDKDARWTKKHGRSYFGDKNHVNVDRKHKLIRRYQVTSASVHDSQTTFLTRATRRQAFGLTAPIGARRARRRFASPGSKATCVGAARAASLRASERRRRTGAKPGLGIRQMAPPNAQRANRGPPPNLKLRFFEVPIRPRN